MMVTLSGVVLVYAGEEVRYMHEMLVSDNSGIDIMDEMLDLFSFIA